MVKDAFYFLTPLLLACLAAFFLGWLVVAVILLGLALFVAYFFRNPHREIPSDASAIVSPADGKIIKIVPHEGGQAVSIFLSVFDVHVNRAPIAGKVETQEYRSGRFHMAFDERASVENEQLTITMTGPPRLTFSLIAGLVARRIVPWIRPGDVLERGDRIGLIRFGSRVDILLPAGCRLAVKEGDRVRGGASILAYWSEAA